MSKCLRQPSYRKNLVYDFKGKDPANGWRYSPETMQELDKKGLIFYPDDKNKQVYKKVYLDSYEGQLSQTFGSILNYCRARSRDIGLCNSKA